MISKKLFGYTKAKEAVYFYTLENKCKTKVEIITYGAAIRGLQLMTKEGYQDVVLGYDTIADYENQDKYMGATVGRCANRIDEGMFCLNGQNYSLNRNNVPNHLHGGSIGFDKKVWLTDEEKEYLCLSLFSPHMDEGYPGDFIAKAYYRLSDDNILTIDYLAKTGEDTIANLTNHSYFNLSGQKSGDILDHRLQINAKEYTPINSSLIPTGDIELLKNTPLDFSEGRVIGKGLHTDCEQLKIANGYDHNYVLGHQRENPLKLAAMAQSPKTGIKMEVYTTQSGLQFYSGNFLDGKVLGKEKAFYGPRSGFCLEAQNFPNAINCKSFPNPVLKEEELYKQTIQYKFSV